jgi:hypothetical protein
MRRCMQRNDGPSARASFESITRSCSRGRRALFAGRSVVLGTAEQPIEPTLHAFGANVIIAPYSAIAAATVSERPVREVIARELRIDLSRDACSTSIVLPFDGSSGDGEAVAAIVRAR